MSIEFCSLASGSSGNSQYIGTTSTHLLVDLGLTTKYIVNALAHLDLKPEMIQGIMITHEHGDHVKGLGAFHRKYKTPIYIHRRTWEAVEGQMGKYHEALVHFIEAGQAFNIGDIHIEPIAVQHDAVAPLGFIMESRGATVAVVTDLGCIDDALLSSLERVQLMLLEANHNVDMLLRGPYPYPLKRRVMGDQGHLSNEHCAEAVIHLYRKGALKSVFLGHLSKDNNTPDLAYETLRSALAMEGIQVDEDILVEMTFRNRIGKRVRVRG